MTPAHDRPPLHAWPARAAVGRAVAKSKVLAHVRTGAAVRQAFTSQLGQIVWSHKLAPETVQLPATAHVPEIEVFQLELKTPTLDAEVLRCIDRAIPFPTLFELHHGTRVQAVAAWKRPSAAVAGAWVCSEHHAGPWCDADTVRRPLPLALDLASLYEQLLRTLLPLPARLHEPLEDQLERIAQWRSADAAERQLASRLARERQFNRKVEINAQLRSARALRDTLAH